jgi:predicted permease
MLTRFLHGVRYVFRGNRWRDDIHREVESHLQMEIDQRVADGASPEEARRTALRDFGGTGRFEEEMADARGLTFWDSLVQDIRYGARMLRRSPGYTLTAVLTLAFGIGVNTAMFSVVNGVLLHPLPYRDSGRLIRIVESAPKVGRPSIGVSIPETWELRQRLHGVQDLVEYHSMSFVLLDRGDADRVSAGVVSSEFFDVFGIRPVHGRTFTALDDELGAEPVLILGYDYWQNKFGGDPNVVGRTVQMNDKVHTIVGVLPQIPQYPRTNDVFMPTSACPFRAKAEPTARTNHRAFSGLSVFARLRPGTSVDQVAADAAAMAAGWARAEPEVYEPEQTGFRASAERLEDQITHDARPILLTLVAATVLVLLIACANVANLSLARTLQRDREIALRAALGAGRWRLVRQLLTESTMVAMAGGLLGLLLAAPTAGLLARFASLFTTRAVDASIDGSVLIFTLAVSVLSGIIFGVVPALSSRRMLVTSLRDGGSQAGDGIRRTRIRGALVIAQVTVCFALVVGAGLLLQSLHKLSTVNVGYRDPAHLLTAQLWGNFSRGTTDVDFVRFHSDLLARMQQAPGVISAAITNGAPFTGVPGVIPFSIEGQAVEPALRPTVDQDVATDDYFKTMGIPIVAGRSFNELDAPDAPRVAIINQSMASRWQHKDPLGSHFVIYVPDNAGKVVEQSFTVVGIAADIRQYNLEQAPIAQFFTPMSQTPGFMAEIVMRTSGDPHDLAGPLKTVVRSLDRTIPVSNVTSVSELRADQLQPRRLSTALLAVFALLALVITLAGVAAVIATSVSQRTREFGVRMALGASRGSVLAMVLQQGMWLLAVGLIIGVAGAFVFGRALAQYLFETAPTDPTVYLAVGALVLAAGSLACLGPARRATSIDPLKALRSE